MPLLLRTVKQNRWIKADAAPLLEKGDTPADPLGDMSTSGNCLSVYEVSEDRSNVERIVRAIAVGRQRIDSMGFVLFDSALLEEAAIQSKSTKGETPDKAANEWHLDLIELSGNKLVKLTRLILEHGETDTVLKKRLRELVEDGITTKELPEELKEKFKKDLT